MEACFVTSNPLPKTSELIPSVKARTFAFSKRNPLQFQSRRVTKPRIIACSRLDSSLPSNDDESPAVDADWRLFRARLIIGGLASRGQESSSSLSPSSVVDPDTVVDYPAPFTLGDKWAHTIHEPEKGCLLIATEKLDGVHIFERTVILLLSTGPMGPSGIILNRPSLMSIKEMNSTVMMDAAGTFSDRPLFFGGPLEEGLFLLTPRADNGVSNSGVFEEVMKGVYFGSRESVGCAAEMVKRNVVGVGDFRFFDGYCGWEKKQLRDEIRAGYWTVAACSPTVLGHGNVTSDGLWEEILGLLGPKKVW